MGAEEGALRAVVDGDEGVATRGGEAMFVVVVGNGGSKRACDSACRVRALELGVHMFLLTKYPREPLMARPTTGLANTGVRGSGVPSLL